MTTTFKLGQRVKITGTVEKQRDRTTWKPEDGVHIYREVRANWAQIKEAPTHPEYGLLRTRLIAADLPAIAEGVIVGKRTMAQGITDPGGWDEPSCFLPGETTQVWLVALHLRRKPVMCFDYQIEAFPMPESITVPTPHIPHPGFHTQGHFMRTAARNIKNDHPVGGYNVTTAVIKLLTDTANAMENTR